MVDEVDAGASVLAGLELALIHLILAVDTLVSSHTLPAEDKCEHSFLTDTLADISERPTQAEEPWKGQIRIAFVAEQLQVISRAHNSTM